MKAGTTWPGDIPLSPPTGTQPSLGHPGLVAWQGHSAQLGSGCPRGWGQRWDIPVLSPQNHGNRGAAVRDLRDLQEAKLTAPAPPCCSTLWGQGAVTGIPGMGWNGMETGSREVQPGMMRRWGQCPPGCSYPLLVGHPVPLSRWHWGAAGGARLCWRGARRAQ